MLLLLIFAAGTAGAANFCYYYTQQCVVVVLLLISTTVVQTTHFDVGLGFLVTRGFDATLGYPGEGPSNLDVRATLGGTVQVIKT